MQNPLVAVLLLVELISPILTSRPQFEVCFRHLPTAACQGYRLHNMHSPPLMWCLQLPPSFSCLLTRSLTQPPLTP